jgi:hypothetical protein
MGASLNLVTSLILRHCPDWISPARLFVLNKSKNVKAE